MRSFVFFVFGAIVGAAGGAIVAKCICDAKMESKITEATIEARDYYKNKSEEDLKAANENVDKQVHEQVVNTLGYGRVFEKSYDVRDDSVTVDYRSVPNNPKVNKPYLYMIDPDEAGEDSDFTQMSLDYYQDGSLVDEEGVVIDDPIETVGDFLDDLSLENPEIYVRNDVTKTEYDICYINASYEQPGGIYD